MVTHEFSASVHDLDASGKAFSFPIRTAWVRGALEGTGARPGEVDGELDVRLSKSGPDVVLVGTLKAELNVDCARCLEPAHVVVSEPISALFVPGASPELSSGKGKGKDTGKGTGDDEDEPTGDEADVLGYDGETVVLDDLVRDELLLGIPMIPLCSEACPGIRPETRSDPAPARDLDPRLSPLQRLKKSQT